MWTWDSFVKTCLQVLIRWKKSGLQCWLFYKSLNYELSKCISFNFKYRQFSSIGFSLTDLCQMNAYDKTNRQHPSEVLCLRISSFKLLYIWAGTEFCCTIFLSQYNAGYWSAGGSPVFCTSCFLWTHHWGSCQALVGGPCNAERRTILHQESSEPRWRHEQRRRIIRWGRWR